MAPGTDSRLTGSTVSPALAAQATAGTAHSARSPETITTFADGFPLAAEKKRSMAAARSYASLPSITALRKPVGRPVSRPMRITWASFDRSEPLGLRRSRVSCVTGGGGPPARGGAGGRGGRRPAGGGGRGGAGRAPRENTARPARLPVVLVDQHRGRGPRR